MGDLKSIKPPLAVFATFLCMALTVVSCSGGSYECTDPLGCLEIPAGNPVVIGAILATSGDQRPLGAASLDSVKKAVAEDAGIFGHPLELITYGTDCTAGSAQMGATEFATNMDLAAVIGPTCSAEEDAAMSVLLDAGIPLSGPVLNSTAATAITNQVLAAIQQVAVQMPDKTIYIPRQALLHSLGLAP